MRPTRRAILAATLLALTACTTAPPRPFSRATRLEPQMPAWPPDDLGIPVDRSTADDIHASAVSVFRYRVDGTGGGSSDVWTSPVSMEWQIRQRGFFVGDCEDFATWCVHLARRAGIRARLVICLTELRQAHCVALVGGWVLCNRQPRAMPPQDLPYTWIKASGYDPGDPWTHITLAPPGQDNNTKPAERGLFY